MTNFPRLSAKPLARCLQPAAKALVFNFLLEPIIYRTWDVWVKTRAGTVEVLSITWMSAVKLPFVTSVMQRVLSY